MRTIRIFLLFLTIWGSFPYSSSLTREDIIDRAKFWMKNGGVSPQSFPTYPDPDSKYQYRVDWSGYAAMAWNLLPNDTMESLAQFGEKITKEELKAGDIILSLDKRIIVIFDKWACNDNTKYWGYEQYIQFKYISGSTTRYIEYVYPYSSNSEGFSQYRHPNLENSPIPDKPIVKPTVISRSEIKKRAQFWEADPPNKRSGVFYSDCEFYPGPDGEYYQTNSSGFVSMAWKIPSNETISTLPKFVVKIEKDELRSGDVLMNEIHVVIFDKWSNYKQEEYWGYEQGRQWQNSTLSRSTTYDEFRYPYWNDKGYVPYRYLYVEPDSSPPPVPAQIPIRKLSRQEIISRAKYWTTQVRGKPGQDVPEPLALADPEGNYYRNNASGYISMVWGLPVNATQKSLRQEFCEEIRSKSQLKSGDIIQDISFGRVLQIFDKWSSDQMKMCWVYEYGGYGDTVATYHEVPYQDYFKFRFLGVDDENDAHPTSPIIPKSHGAHGKGHGHEEEGSYNQSTYSGQAEVVESDSGMIQIGNNGSNNVRLYEASAMLICWALTVSAAANF